MKYMLGIIVAGMLSVSPVLAAQAPPQQGAGGAPMPPITNLQILPKDMPRADLMTTMRGIAGAMGVQCTYCHIMEGRGGRNDMAADEKPTKATARMMMRMVAGINTQLATAITKSDLTKVNCGTCHRGAAIPTKFEPPAPPAGQGAPPPAGRGQ
jgi:hypothetical protein